MRVPDALIWPLLWVLAAGQGARMYYVDNTLVLSTGPGVTYSYASGTRSGLVAEWGAVVSGTDSADGKWLQVGNMLLPKALGGLSVLAPYDGRFWRVPGGKCSDVRKIALTDADSCSLAAVALGLASTTVTALNDMSGPSGCYWDIDDYVLYFNAKGQVGATSTNERICADKQKNAPTFTTTGGGTVAGTASAGSQDLAAAAGGGADVSGGLAAAGGATTTTAAPVVVALAVAATPAPSSAQPTGDVNKWLYFLFGAACMLGVIVLVLIIILLVRFFLREPAKAQPQTQKSRTINAMVSMTSSVGAGPIRVKADPPAPVQHPRASSASGSSTKSRPKDPHTLEPQHIDLFLEGVEQGDHGPHNHNHRSDLERE